MTGEVERSGEPDLPGFVPARIVEVDIGLPLTGVSALEEHSGRSYQRALSVVRLHSQPLGVVEVPLSEHGLTAADYAHHIWSALRNQITEHLREDGLAAVQPLSADGIRHPVRPRCLASHDQVLADPPFASVVIATRDRPDKLAICLRSLLALTYPHYEIIVVDNVPCSDATAELVRTMAKASGPPVRYVREYEPGPSAARNRGLCESNGTVVAFTDDDVIVDAHWLAHLVAGFRRTSGVACVTGNILPVEIETPAQSLIEQFGGFSKGFTRRVFDRSDHRVAGRPYPYAAGVFGSGANIAFRTSALRGIGGFDLALGPATPARGGEDLAVFFTIITRGYRLVYEPAAIVYHHHRRDYASLRNQINGYGVGLTAYLTKCIFDDPRRVLQLLGWIPQGIRFTSGHLSPNKTGNSTHYPSELTRAELLGMAYGPFAYIRSRWRRRTRTIPTRVMPCS